jgi:uncharacterized membrane protein
MPASAKLYFPPWGEGEGGRVGIFAMIVVWRVKKGVVLNSCNLKYY